MAGKQFEVIRDIRHSNPKAPYEDTHYAVGDDYKHVVNDNQISPEGPDGGGPVLREKATKSTAADSVPEEK